MGFHWDLVLSGGLIFGVSLFGLPWMCAAAVQSLTHATSLTVMKKTAPGEKPKVDYVVEQRVTTMLVAIMIGMAPLWSRDLTWHQSIIDFRCLQLLGRSPKEHPDRRATRRILVPWHLVPTERTVHPSARPSVHSKEVLSRVALLQAGMAVAPSHDSESDPTHSRCPCGACTLTH